MKVWKHEWIYTAIVYIQEVIWSMHFQSEKRNMTIETGNPRGDRDLSNFHNYRGLCYGISMMTSRHSGPPIGGEGNFQTTHGSIVVECDATSKHDRDVINTMTSQSVFYVDDATTFYCEGTELGTGFQSMSQE